MADNATLPATGAVVATDDIGGVQYQRIKACFGGDGSATDVSTAAGMPARLQIHQSRVIRNFILDAYTAAPVAEALQSVVQWYGNGAVGATTTPAVVPANKVLRLFGMRLSTKSLATVGSAVLRLRANTGGTVVIGSPLVATLEVGSRAGATTVAMTGGLDHAEIAWDEGLEFPAGTGIGFTLAGYGPTGTLILQGVTRFEAWGAEYSIA